jgi:phosphate transport system substrate-binding protein
MAKGRTISLIKSVFRYAGSILMVGLSGIAVAVGDPGLDRHLPDYRPARQLPGTLVSRGSDTMGELVQSWADRFSRFHPNVVFDIEALGSGTAPAPLLNGTAHIGCMSRKMKTDEYEEFIARYGFRPVAIGVGLDTLAVYVHQSNPIDRLSLPEIDAIFSQTRLGGHPLDIDLWRQLGLTGFWQHRPIQLYTRNTFSGTYEYFREHALFKGAYKTTIRMQPGSAAVIAKIAADPAGIGFSGIGYANPQVKALALSEKPAGEAFSPSEENVYLNLYPLSRPLYIYVVKFPGQPLPEVVLEFMVFVLSRQGQQIIHDIGYMPLSAKAAERQLGLVR